MLATSTHDTKRGEDVRARLAVLSECPARWWPLADRWTGRLAAGVDPADALLLWQTMAGAWPLEQDRCLAYMEKAVREAGLHTTWTDPDPAYERALAGLVERAYADTRAPGRAGGPGRRDRPRRPGQGGRPGPPPPDQPGRPRHLPGHRDRAAGPGRPRQPPPRPLHGRRLPQVPGHPHHPAPPPPAPRPVHRLPPPRRPRPPGRLHPRQRQPGRGRHPPHHRARSPARSPGPPAPSTSRPVPGTTCSPAPTTPAAPPRPTSSSPPCPTPCWSAPDPIGPCRAQVGSAASTRGPQGGQLGLGGGFRPPHDLELVRLVAGHDVDVEVEDALPGRRPGRMDEVHPSRFQRPPQQAGDPARHPRDPRVLLVLQVPEALGVPAGHDQRMPSRRRRDVQERHRVLVLEQPVGRGPPGHDRAEHAVTHRRSLRPGRGWGQPPIRCRPALVQLSHDDLRAGARRAVLAGGERGVPGGVLAGRHRGAERAGICTWRSCRTGRRRRPGCACGSRTGRSWGRCSARPTRGPCGTR